MTSAGAGRGEGQGEGVRGVALLGHRVAVEGGRHRGGFAGDVEQDGGRRAAEKGAPVHAGEQDDRRHRVHGEGQRQEQGNAVRRAEPGQHADQDAEQDAGGHQQDVIGREGDLEAVHQIGEVIHNILPKQYPRMEYRIRARYLLFASNGISAA